MTGEAFDLVSAPDADSAGLRDTLHGWALGAALVTGTERTVVSARALREVCREAHDLLQQLLLVRRACIVLMQAGGTEALALPYTELVAASMVPLRVKHDPRLLPGVLQFLLPGEGLVGLNVPTPGAGWSSDGQSEAERLREALEGAKRALLQSQGRDTVLALIEASLRV